MKFPSCPTIGVLFLAGSLAANANPKTMSPVKIHEKEVHAAPYRYNGVVLAGNFRGSGFCAWDKSTFFSAAHVLYDEGQWLEAPTWYPANHSATLDDSEGIPSRGYYRWANYYSDMADLNKIDWPLLQRRVHSCL